MHFFPIGRGHVFMHHVLTSGDYYTHPISKVNPSRSWIFPLCSVSTNGKGGLVPASFFLSSDWFKHVSGVGDSWVGTIATVAFHSTRFGTKMRLVHALLALLLVIFACSGHMGMAMDGREAAEAMEENPEELLQWALNHSDTEALKKMAEDARQGKEEAVRRMKDIRETMEYLSKQVPSEAQEMQQFVRILESGELGVQTKADAMEGLQFLLESIDNANDFSKMGGVEVLHEMLEEEDENLRSRAAHALGIAAANNPKFQLTVMDRRPEVLRILMEMTKMADHRLQKKGLYALSALVRNVDEVQELFYAHGGLVVLETLADDTSSGDQIRIRALQFFSDLLVHSHKKANLEHALRSSAANMVCPAVELLSHVDVAGIDDILRVVRVIEETNGRRLLLENGSKCNAREILGNTHKKVAADAAKSHSMEYDHELRESAEEESGAQFLEDLAAQLQELVGKFSTKGNEHEL
eukprot:scaffold587_cov339-Pavlova_lutheri.AAC.41